MKRIQLSLAFTLLLALFTTNNKANNYSKPDDSLPIIKETNGVKQLYVNNEPFLIIGS